MYDRPKPPARKPEIVGQDPHGCPEIRGSDGSRFVLCRERDYGFVKETDRAK